MPKPIISEQTFDAPAGRVWKAITDPDEMRQWFFKTIHSFEPVVGFETEFIVNAEGTDYPHIWKVTEVVPNERIVYAWRYGGQPGDSYVVWQLSEAGDGIKLTLSHHGDESFWGDRPVFNREECQAAWDYFVRGTLKKYVDPEAA